MTTLYAFNVEYHHDNGHKSSCIGAGTSLDTARRDLARHVEYYSTECPVIIDLAEIVKICPACNGAGEHVKYWRKSSFIAKRTPCNACNGAGTTQYEKLDVLPKA